MPTTIYTCAACAAFLGLNKNEAATVATGWTTSDASEHSGKALSGIER